MISELILTFDLVDNQENSQYCCLTISHSRKSFEQFSISTWKKIFVPLIKSKFPDHTLKRVCLCKDVYDKESIDLFLNIRDINGGNRYNFVE
jgi:hypothetical protein